MSLGKRRDWNPHNIKVLRHSGSELLPMMMIKKRKIDDGVLSVVAARIYGHKVRALIDSGATRCFILSGVVLLLGLKCTSEETLLQLGNGNHILSRGKVNNVLVVTASLSGKLDLTVTKLLHSVDVVLGMNWLCTVNPIIDWQGSVDVFV